MTFKNKKNRSNVFTYLWEHIWLHLCPHLDINLEHFCWHLYSIWFKSYEWQNSSQKWPHFRRKLHSKWHPPEKLKRSIIWSGLVICTSFSGCKPHESVNALPIEFCALSISQILDHLSLFLVKRLKSPWREYYFKVF